MAEVLTARVHLRKHKQLLILFGDLVTKTKTETESPFSLEQNQQCRSVAGSTADPAEVYRKTETSI